MTGLDIARKLAGYGVPWEHAKILAAVGYVESVGYNPEAELITPYEDSVGLFQINMKAHWDKLIRWTGSRDPAVWRKWLMNPENNIFAAAEVYKSQGLGAWTVYKKGTYIPYLDKLEQLVVKPGGTPQASIPASTSGGLIRSAASTASKGVAIAGGAIILAVVLAAGVALAIAGGLKNA